VRRAVRSDVHNEYVAFYSNTGQSGRYRGRANVREVVLPGGVKLVWDQVLVPVAARRENLDVLFHHKFSIPCWRRARHSYRRGHGLRLPGGDLDHFRVP